MCSYKCKRMAFESYSTHFYIALIFNVDSILLFAFCDKNDLSNKKDTFSSSSKN